MRLSLAKRCEKLERGLEQLAVNGKPYAPEMFSNLRKSLLMERLQARKKGQADGKAMEKASKAGKG